MSVLTILILVLIGLFAGIAAGIVGIGGGIIIVPALVYLLGLTQHEAQGTSLALMLPPIGILAFIQYYKAGNITNLQIQYAGIIALTFIIGGLLGGKWAQKIDPNLLKLIFGIFMAFIALKLMYSGMKNL